MNEVGFHLAELAITLLLVLTKIFVSIHLFLLELRSFERVNC